MSKEARTEIDSLGEFGLIKLLTDNNTTQNESTVKAVGDDAAVLRSGDHFKLLSTDMLLEGVHFDLSYVPLKHLGYKSVVVNLSDIYAMNGNAKQITVSIAISNRFSVEAVEELYSTGVLTYCLTLDPNADDYVKRIFGANNYTIIDNVDKLPEQLPTLFASLTA